MSPKNAILLFDNQPEDLRIFQLSSKFLNQKSLLLWLIISVLETWQESTITKPITWQITKWTSWSVFRQTPRVSFEKTDLIIGSWLLSSSIAGSMDRLCQKVCNWFYYKPNNLRAMKTAFKEEVDVKERTNFDICCKTECRLKSEEYCIDAYLSYLEINHSISI